MDSKMTLGQVIDELGAIISSRSSASTDESYTALLLQSPEDKVLKKVAEEAAEVIMAAKDYSAACAAHVEGVSQYGTARDHVVYETGDLLYHLLVLCARHEISLDDIAAELHSRFK